MKTKEYWKTWCIVHLFGFLFYPWELGWWISRLKILKEEKIIWRMENSFDKLERRVQRLEGITLVLTVIIILLVVIFI